MKVRESAENYLKTILLLQSELGEVRSIDVANALGVSKPSVSNAIKKLRREGLVVMAENYNLLLTEDGFKYATTIFERHQIIEKFLTDNLGIDRKTAHKDSCHMEHLLSPETLSKIKENYEGNKMGASPL
ncbi:metal-dependent transcriptional regulator [Aminipila butyrica]|uniref:Metal-dependent transcriptional regulator n=2 Tax=Aminipila butyrica TaxID=433296 RepID=A0A858BZU4_9FIRM|nr:metal-dependent transcriptional regulator [Aminipila butyrica]